MVKSLLDIYIFLLFGHSHQFHWRVHIFSFLCFFSCIGPWDFGFLFFIDAKQQYSVYTHTHEKACVVTTSIQPRCTATKGGMIWATEGEMRKRLFPAEVARFLPQLWRVYLHTQSSRGNLGRRREARSSTEHRGDQNWQTTVRRQPVSPTFSCFVLTNAQRQERDGARLHGRPHVRRWFGLLVRLQVSKVSRTLRGLCQHRCRAGSDEPSTLSIGVNISLPSFNAFGSVPLRADSHPQPTGGWENAQTSVVSWGETPLARCSDLSLAVNRARRVGAFIPRLLEGDMETRVNIDCQPSASCWTADTS